MIEQGDLQADTMVPDTIQGVLMARIDRLPEASKRLLQTASMLGREFSPTLLKAIWESSGVLEPLLLELKRLDAIQKVLWPKALQGDISGINSVLKISDRRCRLLGLRGPLLLDRRKNDRILLLHLLMQGMQLLFRQLPDTLPVIAFELHQRLRPPLELFRGKLPDPLQKTDFLLLDADPDGFVG